TPDKETPDFDSVFVIGKMQASLQGKDNAIRQLKKQLSELQATCVDTKCTAKVLTTDSQLTKVTDPVTNLQAQNDHFRAENDKVKHYYKQLYDSIKITHAKHIKQVTKLTAKNVTLKTGVSKAKVQPSVLTRTKHAVDVELIVPRLRNNRDAHLDYLRHLKESVETIRDIVEEAKVVRPLDRSIVSACCYTKHSQELLEYTIGTCPRGSQLRAKQLAHIPLIKKNQVIVAQPSNKLDSTIHPHVVTVTSQKTNVPVPPSTRVDCCPIASGSQSMSHVKSNRISPAKGGTKLPIDDQPRKNKSHLRTSTHLCDCYCTDKMADVNAPSDQTPTMASPVRADEQILPHIRWIPIGKSNCYLDLEKSQSNPIYKIAVDLLKNTNFFRAFTASSNLPSIYIQQFWDTILYDKKAGCYKCQLDEQWFDLTKETLREALQITPVNRNQAFTAPPSIDGLIDFVNQLGYPKPRAPVLQILWGIVTRANIDYAERIWEEFTQSIHTFIEEKRNLSQHTSGKKRATLIVIPRIRLTKLISHHLQRKHRFHPRPDSPLHLSNEEPVFGYLKFSAKGTKREIFGMPIPSKLITTNIREAPYYQEYQENVAKHKGFLAGETGSTQDLPTPKPAKPTRKPQSTAQKAPLKPSISSPVTSTQPAPTSVPAKTQENKRKQATGTTNKPAKAKRIKRSASRKTRQPKSSPKSVESMKDAYALPKGPLLPVVIREPESGKYQPLPEVPGKGNGKVSEEQVSHDLLSLQKHKKTSPADQYIFQRRVSEPTASSFRDESPYEAGTDPNAQAEGQTGSDTGAQAEGQAGSNPDETSEGQAGSNPDETSEGQARPDRGNVEARVQSTSSPVVHARSDREHLDLDVANVSPQPSTEQLYEGFTATVYPNVQENLKLAVEEPVLLEEPASSSGTLSSLQHLSRDFSFGDQFFSDKPSDADKSEETKVESMVNVPIQQALSSISLMTSPIIDLTSRPKSPKEHQQLKATTTNTTTTTTTTTLPPQEAPQQSTTEAMMVKRIDELEHTLVDLIQVNKTMEERLDKHGARLYTLEQLDIPQQVSIAVSEVVTDAVDWAMQAPLCNHYRDLPEADMKEILHQRMWESDSYKSHEDHMQLFEALEKSINRDHFEELAHDLAEARKKRKKGRESPKTPPGLPSHQPPPPPPPAGPSGTSGAPRASGSQVTPPPPPPTSTNQDSPSKGSAAPSLAKMVAATEHQAWSTPDVTLKPLVSLTPEDLDMDEAMDIGSAHIPKVNLRQGWWKPFEEERPTTPKPAWSIRSSDVSTNNWASTMASNYSPPPEDSLLMQTAYEIVKVFHPDVIHLQYQMEECHKLLTDSVDDPILRHNVSKPLPLGGLPGQVIIQSDFFFNKDLEYLRYDSKGRRPALSISKMKATYYLDAGLDQMVPDQFWIEEECKYDIAAMYGISYWWFQRQRFYIDRHTSEGDRSTVRTHMQILNVVRIEVFSMYGYDYMKKIVLRRADLNEHVITERDFKYLYPSDFEDLNLLNLQGQLNHLPPKDKKIITTAVNQWTRQLVIRQHVEDFQLGIES
nr:integrase, catalytic region, zinc finger, CCHC-type, peptidase aspartic, catalytic [Tanacetum cinerariifolium]